jgi:hypothetical protein
MTKNVKSSTNAKLNLQEFTENELVGEMGDWVIG